MAAEASEAREAEESAGAAEDSGEGTSEQLDEPVRKRAKMSETTAASRVSEPDPLFSVLMDKVEEMDRHDAAADAREVRYSSAMSAIVPCILCPPQVDMKARQGPYSSDHCGWSVGGMAEGTEGLGRGVLPGEDGLVSRGAGIAQSDGRCADAASRTDA